MASSNVSVDALWYELCISFGTGLYIVPSFTVVWSFLFFSLYFLVLQTGFQRWQQNKRSSVSHADLFTYHSFVFELVSISGHVAYSVAFLRFNYVLNAYAIVVIYSVYPGFLSLKVLTCVECYLAVVYPVVYLSLKQQKWVWARNVLIFVIWVFCLIWATVIIFIKNCNIPYLTMLGTAACVIALCSVQVLRTLRNPSPGEGRRVSQSKRKAFCTMLAILAVLLLWLTYESTTSAIDNLLEPDAMCKLHLSGYWLGLPGNLVLPLLFLHRAGKLPKCRGKKSKHPGLELRGRKV